MGRRTKHVALVSKLFDLTLSGVTSERLFLMQR